MAFLVWIFALWQQKKTKCELYNGVFKEKTCKSHHILKFLFHMSFLDIEFLVVTRTQHESKNKLYIYIYIYRERERERINLYPNVVHFSGGWSRVHPLQKIEKKTLIMTFSNAFNCLIKGFFFLR